MRPLAHLRTVNEHRRLVRRYCFRVGLYRQGLLHDLSKYSPAEFWRGAKYYQGNRSPNDAERVATGLSLAWLHHKGRNRHHFEYWIDWRKDPEGGVVYAGNRMPMRYVAEMFCDRVAASRVYLKEKYTDASPWEYFMNGPPGVMMHPDTTEELKEMLLILKDRGEEAAFRHVRERLKKSREDKSF